jgi:hypothetical protein
VSLRERKRDFGNEERMLEQRKNAGQIHLYEFSLREQKKDFGEILFARIYARRICCGLAHKYDKKYNL